MKMSGECYTAKNLHMELNSSRKDTKLMETMDTKYDPRERDQLLEYETMVSSAESKCSQLKGQLERIKQFYNNQSEVTKAATLNMSDRKPTRARIETLVTKNITTIKPVKKIRQNSQAIGTDTTGASLGTINNILAGITKPIQIPDFYRKVENKNYSSSSKTAIDTICENPLHGVEEVKINSKSKQLILCARSKSKFHAKRSKSKVMAITSSGNFKKIKKTTLKMPTSDKRYNKSSDSQINRSGIPVINKRSRKILLKQRFTNSETPKGIIIKTAATPSPSRRNNTDLVEIYHNTAVKESKSSDSDIAKKKYSKAEKPMTDIELVPPLIMGDNEPKMEEPKGVVSCLYRNYTMPTIASRMKRVAKYYMNSFNIKSIPFCLSTSTSPSHNIGINIQQVMSMVKSRQPNARLSPTLAYNIGLAAGKREGDTLRFVASSITSRTFYSQCPLTKSAVNYQHLQEIAKTIPQETIEETIEEAEENEETHSPDTQSMIITGPSGDVKITNRKHTVWTASFDEKKCTCVTPKGVAFQQIINKFNGAISKSKINNSASIIPVRGKDHPKMERIGGGEEYTMKPTAADILPLQNKERKLKEVLGKLHDEFERMTKTYDELLKKNEDGTANADTLKEMEALDKELNSKEEEIIMVMSLYKEVLNLKQQVKTLRDRTSRDNISIKTQSSKFNGCSNMTTAGLLNKLLQRVQHFQTHYKRR